ncbi:Dabb family protein [Reichenbachiella carrageenanivorans]|uniref:Dabb family protein n=1 Tax=Reichenbachiella carrageenanivorans TaxID=2979869 RepID=A0ABY6D0Y3_9BACT|nr:Dabb family protein [Reichenbachiella carrageenanivorans]UXX79584.1 Dabb family protein [Reichenbachiella carrageenanivorans]
MKTTPYALLILCMLLGCESVKTKDMISGQFAHTVLIWMKNPNSESDKNKLKTGLNQLIEASEYIRSAHLGVPALTAREVVDNSYSYCFIVTFGSKEEQDKYQVEPAHKKFMADCENLMSKILIYDSMNVLEAGENLK